MDQKAPDKSRLRQVQTTDLTESRLNDDFVYWLKKNGTNYLLVVLLIACAVLGWNYYHRQQVARSSVAWNELNTASDSRMPEPLEQLAKDHAEVPQVAMVALIMAGDLRLSQIQTGELSPAAGSTPAVPLDDAARKIAQDAAEENYTKAAQIATSLTAGSESDAAPIIFSSLFGRAAIAESRGEFDASRKYLEQAATLASERWPRISEVAKARAAGLVSLQNPIAIPAAAEIPVKTAPAAPQPASDDVFNSILQEQQAGEQKPAEQPAQQPTQGGSAPTPAPVTPPAPPSGGG